MTTGPSPRRIAVVTGSRADYGLLHWTIREIIDDPALELQLVVTGAHLSPLFGETWREIEADGIPIAAKLPVNLDDDTPDATAQAMADMLRGMTRILGELDPHIMLVLGDRFEILGAAQAAMLRRVPIAHVHGGETTEGIIDEVIRHATTKMAHVHLAATEPYARRIIQMGESPDRVFVVGAPGVDNLARLEPIDRDMLLADLGLPTSLPLFVVTYHPVTLAENGGEGAMQSLCDALAEFPDATILVTGVNADPGNAAIRKLIMALTSGHGSTIVARESLGQRRYLSALRQAAVVIGNSSSGLIEAPAAGVPTVNIGPRQRGRLRAPSVIDCGETASEIAAAIRRALDPAFREAAFRTAPPYGSGGAAMMITRILREVRLDGILMKSFHDLPDVAIQ